MAERAVATSKAQESKQKCSNSCKQNVGFNSSGSPADMILQLQRTAGNQAVQRLVKSGVLQAKLKIGQNNDVYEQEADRTANEVMGRLDNVQPSDQEAIQAPAVSMAGLGAGKPISTYLRRRFESAFGSEFSGVRLHTGPAAAAASARLGARAFTHGRNIVFGDTISNPESSEHHWLLAHELTHVVQQGMSAGVSASPIFSSLSRASSESIQTVPQVTNVVTSANELGVGGVDITATATVAGAGTRLTWRINPGGAVPAGVSVIGTGRRVRIHAAQPGAGVVIGGIPIIIRAEETGSAPLDFFDSPPVMLVQVVRAIYTNNPALANVPSLGPGNFPPNTAEPNRDGIAGNTAVINAVTAPAGRPITVAFRRSLGATLAGNVITPGARTGNIDLRITDTATRARLNEIIPSTVNPPVPMATMVVNAVPTRVRALLGAGALGPYGVLNTINFASSDPLHPPLTRIVGELITGLRDDFNIAPPNGAFNPAFLLALAVPANIWNDQLITPAGVLNVADGRPAIDVNRFVGPGVPHLPRRLIYQQQFQYSSWQGGGAVVSNTIASGQHIRSLIGSPGAFRFRTEHRFGAVAAPPRIEPYVGSPLIILSNITATPTAAGATGLAADNVATANLAVNSNVPGRTVNWNILTGDIGITAGNPAVLPATATLRAGNRTGNFRVRVADSIFPNRRVDGSVRVVPVRLRNLRAVPNRVPAGTLTSTSSINAEPGGRTLNWTVDPAAAAAGVTVVPASTGPGLAMNVTVSRPGGFTGQVTVTATDAVLPARTENVRIRFL
ncbi:eCIS core domain-containing protein [Methanosarcina sp. Mfa9]|uniref:eCIS core domain-containing protein n=1 Tax=Methanosarcina sp. Mfa9 TaxID=3439063 RepID=UPI003F869751